MDGKHKCDSSIKMRSICCRHIAALYFKHPEFESQLVGLSRSRPARPDFAELYVFLGQHMKSSFAKRDKRQIKKKNEFVMPFCGVLNLFTAPSVFHAKSLYFLV